MSKNFLDLTGLTTYHENLKDYIEEQVPSTDDFMSATNPTGTGSFSLNRKANTTVGNYSFAEGSNTTASGNYSHAEGRNTTAIGDYSHAEGNSTTASGGTSHAEGLGTTANGYYSHAEGYQSTASGVYSHAEGYATTANHASQHVFGEFNIADDSTEITNNRGNYVEIVGNGTGTSARSNARTLDWNGNEVLAGTLTAVDQPQEKISATEPTGQNVNDYWLQAYTPS